MTRRLLTQEQLKEALSYEPETGKFHWLVRKGSRAAQGQEAGGICKTHGYVFIRLNKVLYRAHHLAWLYVEGVFPPEDMDVDHLNQNRADNRWSNLRLATRSQNNYNRSQARGCRKRHHRWTAHMTVNYKSVYIGSFDTEEEAHNAYLRAKRTAAEEGHYRR